MPELALSIRDQYIQDRAILTKPISSLAKMAGLRVDDVYKRLIPELAKKDLTEVIKFAEVGLRYASIVDRNRLREECGEEFISALSMIIQAVNDGLASSEKWIVRKAIKLHGDLIDEQAEKTRFVEVLMTERKLEYLMQSQKNLDKLNEEIIELESRNGMFVSKGENDGSINCGA